MCKPFHDFDVTLEFCQFFAIFLPTEFCREGKEEWVPFDSTAYCSTSAYDAASPIFQEIVATMESLNITVEQVHEDVLEYSVD